MKGPRKVGEAGTPKLLMRAAFDNMIFHPADP